MTVEDETFVVTNVEPQSELVATRWTAQTFTVTAHTAHTFEVG